MKLASGTAPVTALRRAGVAVGLGTDGAASNNDLDMFEAMRQAAFLHKLATGDPRAIPARRRCEWRRSTGRARWGWRRRSDRSKRESGPISSWSSMTRARQTPMYDPLSHLVYVTRGDDVRTTIVNGRVLMRDRKVLTLDEAAVLAEARAWIQKVRAAVGNSPPGRRPTARRTCMRDSPSTTRDDRRRASRRWRQQIETAYPDGEEIHLVGVLKGGFMFMADLVRAMSARVTLDFIAVSSYAKSTKSSGEVRLLKDLDASLEGRHVIIVEDIVDTGLDADLPAGHPARARAEDPCGRPAC